jgi:carbon-monoxide dehydrogenase small subunit
MKVPLSFVLNGEEHFLMIRPNRTLLDVIRVDLGLTGTKLGCGQGKCGACTVLLNGEPVNACLILAPQVNGKEVLTVEGLGGDALHPLQKAFVEKGAVQCGYCTPGMLMTAKGFLNKHPHPTKEDIRAAIAGNLCRCTGYKNIAEAIHSAAYESGNSPADSERDDV